MAVNDLRVSFDDSDHSVPMAFSWAEYVDSAFLVPNVAQTFTVPARAKIVLFNSLSDFFVKRGGPAAIPSASVTNGTGSELSPRGKVVVQGETISLISSAANTVTLTYFGA